MKIFNWILVYFQLLGICVVFIDNKNFYIRHALNLINILHAFVAIVAGFSIYYFESYLFYLGDIVSRSSDVAQIAVPVLAYFIIVFHGGNLKRNDQVEIWANFTKVNSILGHFNLDLEECKWKMFKNYLWKLLLWVLISIGIYVRIMQKIWEADQNTGDMLLRIR